MINCDICKCEPAGFKCSCCHNLYLCNKKCQKHSHTVYYETEKKKNNKQEYRKVLFTNRLQLVDMFLNPGETIPMEVHKDTTQIFYVESGSGEAEINGIVYGLAPGTWITIPAGAKHEIRADPTSVALSLKTIYSKPEH